MSIPTITGVTSPAWYGGQVTITGSGFGTTAGHVWFDGINGLDATIRSWTDTQIVCLDPCDPEVTYQPWVYVQRPDTYDASWHSFTAGATPPYITSVTPSAGPGMPVIISGDHFWSTTGTVLIGGASAGIVSWNNTQIVANNPLSPTADTAETISVYAYNSGLGGSISGAFVALAAPTISSLSSTWGYPGSFFEILGTNFRSGCVAYMGGVACTMWVVFSTTLQVYAPSSGLGLDQTYDVVVTTVAGTSNAASYHIATPPPPPPAPPSISSVSPDTGSTNDLITITGSYFGASQGGSYVKFGTHLAAITSWSDTSIVASVPTINPGNQNVTVTTGGGTSPGVAFLVIGTPLQPDVVGYPDGTQVAVFRPAAPDPTDNKNVVLSVWTQWADVSLTTQQADDLGDQILSWLDANRWSGTITVQRPTLSCRDGSQALTARIRAGDRIVLADIPWTVLHPLLITAVTIAGDTGVATLTVGETSATFVARLQATR